MNRIAPRLALIGSIAFATAAATFTPATVDARPYNTCRTCGTVEDIDAVWTEDRRVGSGAVVGALIGGVLGNQVGSGSGRKAATVAGAVAGGAVGHNVQKNRRSDVRGYVVTVRMDRGGYRTIETARDYDLRPGDRVRVSGRNLRPIY